MEALLALIIGALAFVYFLLSLLPRSVRRSIRRGARSRYRKTDYVTVGMSERGYPIYQHRVFAEQALGRKLFRGEVVHHINFQKDDNRLSNLCVMRAEDHDDFHAWHDWVRTTYRRRPKHSTQIKKLKERYGGIVLDEVERRRSRIAK